MISIHDDKGKVCYIDSEGNMILETKYPVGGDFSEGLAVVALSRDGKYGFIDEQGNLVIDMRFDDTGDFSEGYCKVEVKKKWGLINRSGEFVIKPKYHDMGNCSCGLIGVEKKEDDNPAYIDTEGNVVIPNNGTKHITDFSDGLVSSRDDKKRRHGYRNTKGEWAIHPIYTLAFDFSEGLGGVAKLVGKEELTGFVDREGNEVLPFKFSTTIAEFHDDRLIVWKESGDEAWAGAIDKTGNLVIDYKFAYLDEFYEGLASACTQQDGKNCFINTNGEMVIPEEYIRIMRPFKNEHAWVVHEKEGHVYINKKGKIIYRWPKK